MGPINLSITDVVEFFGRDELRWYQVAARNEFADCLERGLKRMFLVLPTGAGKTITVAATCGNDRIRKALGVKDDRPLRILYCALNHRLLTQAERTFLDECNVELYTQTPFSKIPEGLVWDLAILDEGHHESCLSIQYQLDQLGERPILAMSATPDRPDGCLLKFDHFICPMSREQAVEEGWLAETQLFTFVDTAARDKTDTVVRILKHYWRQMGQTIIYMRTRDEVARVTAWMQSNVPEVNTVGLTTQSASAINHVLDSFSAGETNFIVNCGRLSEGVDVKGCVSAVLGRNLGSYVQYNQIIGRTARPDSESKVWELVDPLSPDNLDGTVVVGTPQSHTLIYNRGGRWIERDFGKYHTQANAFEALLRG